MLYSEKVMEHFNNPHNVGSLDANDPDVGSGTYGSPACGDIMNMHIKIDGNGLIIDAKFKTFGYGSAIASSSLFTDKVMGKTLEDALKISNKEIAKELELPPIKIHCSVMAQEALKNAIADLKQKKMPENSLP